MVLEGFIAHAKLLSIDTVQDVMIAVTMVNICCRIRLMHPTRLPMDLTFIAGILSSTDVGASGGSG